MENHRIWLTQYFAQYSNNIFTDEVKDKLYQLYEICLKAKLANKKLILAGNGASASISSHLAVDFTKQGHVRAINFNEASLITCFSNDYGYDNWLAKALELYADDGDVVILISCSGKSPNIVNAAKYAKQRNLCVVSFTGFSEQNQLKVISDLSFWMQSNAYNVVESVHTIWLTTVVDMLVGRAEYSVTE